MGMAEDMVDVHNQETQRVRIQGVSQNGNTEVMPVVETRRPFDKNVVHAFDLEKPIGRIAATATKILAPLSINSRAYFETGSQAQLGIAALGSAAKVSGYFDIASGDAVSGLLKIAGGSLAEVVADRSVAKRAADQGRQFDSLDFATGNVASTVAESAAHILLPGILSGREMGTRTLRNFRDVSAVGLEGAAVAGAMVAAANGVDGQTIATMLVGARAVTLSLEGVDALVTYAREAGRALSDRKSRPPQTVEDDAIRAQRQQEAQDVREKNGRWLARFEDRRKRASVPAGDYSLLPQDEQDRLLREHEQEIVAELVRKDEERRVRKNLDEADGRREEVVDMAIRNGDIDSASVAYLGGPEEKFSDREALEVQIRDSVTPDRQEIPDQRKDAARAAIDMVQRWKDWRGVPPVQTPQRSLVSDIRERIGTAATDVMLPMVPVEDQLAAVAAVDALSTPDSSQNEEPAPSRPGLIDGVLNWYRRVISRGNSDNHRTVSSEETPPRATQEQQTASVDRGAMPLLQEQFDIWADRAESRRLLTDDEMSEARRSYQETGRVPNQLYWKVIPDTDKQEERAAQKSAERVTKIASDLGSDDAESLRQTARSEDDPSVLNGRLREPVFSRGTLDSHDSETIRRQVESTIPRARLSDTPSAQPDLGSYDASAHLPTGQSPERPLEQMTALTFEEYMSQFITSDPDSKIPEEVYQEASDSYRRNNGLVPQRLIDQARSYLSDDRKVDEDTFDWSSTVGTDAGPEKPAELEEFDWGLPDTDESKKNDGMREHGGDEVDELTDENDPFGARRGMRDILSLRYKLKGDDEQTANDKAARLEQASEDFGIQLEGNPNLLARVAEIVTRELRMPTDEELGIDEDTARDAKSSDGLATKDN